MKKQVAGIHPGKGLSWLPGCNIAIINYNLAKEEVLWSKEILSILKIMIG